MCLVFFVILPLKFVFILGGLTNFLDEGGKTKNSKNLYDAKNVNKKHITKNDPQSKHQ
jgi:hypothetical protein